ncbi:putative vacuolar amino acid transporter YPQ1 [Erysiphe neolycopersici]|uniref:Putative vacuolar amino acid transporter YPQ1 n=1 Tax=Erysiphe neolycopersici TaxID=212602 RepID=A0A420HWR7_9PEZI|nr:putative vacuolar amino acid transporter YPQ1 [Erysiphe neolycopersici]
MYLSAIRSSRQDDLTLQEAFSGVSGSISLAAWVFLLVPQFILNYRNGNANGISVAFLSVWTLGDLANLSGGYLHIDVIGALWSSLVPTVIIIAIYYCFTDILLIAQISYYKYLQSRTNCIKITITSVSANEHTSLLASQSDHDFIHPTSTPMPQQDTIEGKRTRRSPLLNDAMSFLAVIVIGSIGWIIAFYTKIWTPTPLPNEASPGIIIATPIGAQILGYSSAFCYLTARIPQILKNYRKKSCEGLASLFFILSILGNATYGLSILCHSLQKQYLITNLPWLIGSLGTMVEDVIIFAQFRHYSNSQILSK